MHNKIRIALVDLIFLMSLVRATVLAALHFVFVSHELDS